MKINARKFILWSWLLSLFILSVPNSGTVSAQTCPGEGDCCIENDTPGCEDEACCNAVCEIDSYCCDPNYTWDNVCAEEAWELCGELDCIEGFCPGDGDCCEPNSSPDCEDEACCNTVCTYDPFCCLVEWDENCAYYAQTLCGNHCSQACCTSSTSCLEVDPNSCTNTYNGIPMGPGTDCQTTECPACADACHYSADFDYNCYITLEDIKPLIDKWLQCGCEPENNWCNFVDLNESGCIDIVDFAIFSSQWLKCSDPYGENCDSLCDSDIPL